MYDVLVLGSGIAGLTTALHAAARGMSTLVLTKGELSHSATRYAQGGVAAALEDPDSPDLHLADTLVAGAGLCDVDAVRALVTEGPARVRELAELGAHFDTAIEGDGAKLLLAREGGHSLARVVHAGGDATGAEIERALVAAVEPAAIEVREGWFALELLVEAGVCRGVRALGPNGAVETFAATNTVLATGGVGQCFAVTTNPTLSTGDGIALGAARRASHVPTSSSCSSTPPRCTIRRCRGRSCPRHCEVRERSSAIETVSRSWPASTHSPTSPRAMSCPVRSTSACARPAPTTSTSTRR